MNDTKSKKKRLLILSDVQGKDNLLRRYSDAFPEGTVIGDDYIRKDAVEAMVNNLCKEEA
jgi:hypothetical protein